MKRLAWVLWAVAASAPALAAEVGVSIAISEPGVYGRIDVGRFPQPTVIAAQPVVITRPVAVAPQPVYLWVPPGHHRRWARYCHEYRACGTPVYFVRNDWYRDHVMAGRPGPGQRWHGEGRGRGHGHRGD